MDELKIDWNQERPNEEQIIQMWKTIRFEPLEEWSEGTKTLKEKVEETHCNGGIQLHKYKVIGDVSFKWFADRSRLQEMKFLKNLIKHQDLQDYRNDLQIKKSNPKIRNVEFSADIYDLPGKLARIMGQGGAYKNIDPRKAWEVAVNFIESEFQNRFGEILLYYFVADDAEWFFDVAWDYSIILFDKRNYEVIFIDVTDTD